MNCLSKLNTKTFVAASLLAGAGVTFASVGIAKGYNLSPLETYIIESFAQEQIDGFINSGATTLFESPKIFYITPRALARQVKTDLSGAQKKYLGNYGIVKSFVSKTNKDKTRVQFDIPKPDYTLDLHLAKNADPDLAKEVSPGERHGFYCQITSVDKSSAVLSGCLPLRQFASLKRKQIEALIHRYLAGEKVLDPNLPTYAMMAYMAVVSARSFRGTPSADERLKMRLFSRTQTAGCVIRKLPTYGSARIPTLSLIRQWTTSWKNLRNTALTFR